MKQAKSCTKLHLISQNGNYKLTMKRKQDAYGNKGEAISAKRQRPQWMHLLKPSV